MRETERRTKKMSPHLQGARAMAAKMATVCVHVGERWASH